MRDDRREWLPFIYERAGQNGWDNRSGVKLGDPRSAISGFSSVDSRLGNLCSLNQRKWAKKTTNWPNKGTGFLYLLG